MDQDETLREETLQILTYRNEYHNVEFVRVPYHPDGSDVDERTESPPARRVRSNHLTESVNRYWS